MFAEDTTAYFDTTTGFAQAATVGGASVAVIFDNANAIGSVGPFGMASTQPSITLPTAQVPSTPVGTTVVVGGGTYLVAAHEPDGTGVSRLLLERAV